MARKARVKSASGIYHVLIAGEKDCGVFEKAQDHEKFIELLGEYSDVCGFKLYAYCVMENHVHILLNDCGGDISHIMKRIMTSYAYWFNNKYDRQGQLFADRFKSEPIEGEEDFKNALRFIHVNPVKDKLAASPEQYRYGSYADYFSDKKISSDMARRLFGGVREFAEYHAREGMPCLEITRKENVLTDEQLSAVIERDYLVTGPMILKLSNEEQEKIYSELQKKYNVSIRQLARILDVSLSKIWRLLSGKEKASQKG